jgi:hypothetical protein
MADRSRERIFNEIEARFGFVSPFPGKARQLEILTTLWQQPLSCYIDNPQAPHSQAV